MSSLENTGHVRAQYRWGALFSHVGKVPWIPIILLAPVVVWGLFGPWMWPHEPTAIDFAARLKPPVWLEGGTANHLLGTDQFGRDLLSRLIEGARVALIVAIFGVFLAALVGVAAGLAAGYFGGVTDNIIMRIVDVKMSVPAILLTILIGSAIGAGVTTVVAAIAITFWADYARVVRGETLSLKERGFVELAKVADCSHLRILTRHILPNLQATIVVLVTLQLGRALILEAAITYIGIGIQPPSSAWGLMISDGRSLLSTAWWLAAFPGFAITATVLGANLLGDWLRDALDPKVR